MDAGDGRADDDRLIRASADRIYGDGRRIWDERDGWNVHKRRSIDNFALRYAVPRLRRAAMILDAGCGSEPYDWMPDRAVGLDRFERQVQRRSNPVVGDLTYLPFASGSIDFAVCIASVLNYVSAPEALGELSRTTRYGGGLLLHFETSTSAEHVGRRTWRKSAVRIETINNGEADTIWIYRPAFIYSLLEAFGYRIVQRSSFHIASSFGLRIGLSQAGAAVLSSFDKVLPMLAYFGDDVILLAEKRA